MRYGYAFVLLAIVDVALSWNAAPAHARAQNDLPYPLAESYSTALRFVRVDRGCKVVDKDSDAAFVTFECPDDGGRVKRGSLELIRVPGGARAQVTLADDTHGMELRWLELYERKLREELGVPLPPHPAQEPAKAAPKDGGT